MLSRVASILLCRGPLLRQLLPLPAWSPYRRADLPADLLAAVTVLFLAVPQGLAYATIAGLPPAAGLYAATIPTIVSSVFRSSSHVLAGPTNALSLLVGAAIAAGLGADPMTIALTLAFMVGIIQVFAGAMRLGALVDFISSAVVLGYITGAGVLIGIGQLYNATGTDGPRGRIWTTVGGWAQTLTDAHLVSTAFAIGTVLLIIAIRAVNGRTGRRVPGAIVAVMLGLGINVWLGLEHQGLKVVSDLAPIATGLPPLTVPDLSLIPQLVSVAFAVAVLSLVESTSVARAIAGRTGEHVDASTEFVGQGLSNVAAAFFGGYPVSGSLARSVLNERVGARTRLSGIVTGVLLLVVLVSLGSILNHTPVACLAGSMFIVAYDLVDVPRIRQVVKASRADGLAFLVTLIGTWVLSLDQAIYVGVGISVILFLRRARLLRIVELVPDAAGTLQERPSGPQLGDRPCRGICVLNVEGALFFGAATELRDALAKIGKERDFDALVVRLKRAQGLDVTSATVLADAAVSLQAAHRRLILVGLSRPDMRLLERSGLADRIGRKWLFPTQPVWFSALQDAGRVAGDLCGQDCADCAFRDPAVMSARRLRASAAFSRDQIEPRARGDVDNVGSVAGQTP